MNRQWVTTLLSSSTSLVHERVGHVVASYRHFILVWGGFKGEKSASGLSEYCPTDQLWMYNCATEVWSVALTKGQVPYKNSGGTGLVLDDHLYIFGGAEEVNDEEWRYGNDLYRLNLHSLVWEKLEPKGDPPMPCDKAVGWADDNRLYFFSGYGPVRWNHGRNNARDGAGGRKWMGDTSARGERGWTNQLIWYEVREDRWNMPQGKASRLPPPRAAAAATVSPNNRVALVFGGRLAGNRMNDMYAFDLDTQIWSNNLNRDVEIVPDGRSWHSIDFIESDRAIVYGGLDQMGRPSRSWWEVKLGPGGRPEWSSKPMPEPLVWHKSSFCQNTGELILVGGVLRSPYLMVAQDHVDQLLVLQFQPASLFRLSLRSVINTTKSSSLIEMTKQLPSLLSDVIMARVLT